MQNVETNKFPIEFQKMTIGKQLLLEDLPFSPNDIHIYCKNGFLTHREGILTEKNNSICTRCGNKDKQWFAVFPCARCGKSCLYCRKCILMGRISSCTKLYSWSGPPLDLEITPNLIWSGSLSPGQKTASERVVKAVEENKDLLVWAV